MDFKHTHVLVMGLGILGGGVGTATFFASRGARVTITDTKTREELSDSIKKLSVFDIEYVLGKHREHDITRADLIIKNPSVPSDSPFLSVARAHGIPLHMAESLFMTLSPTDHVIGVTGTRGKSTTSALISRVLQASGRDVYLAGNIPGDSTLSLLDVVKKKSWVVLELSSWQLESFGWWNISPPVAVVTNIYEDHLNRYASMNEYITDKKHIFTHQKKHDIFVTNEENKVTRMLAHEAPGRVVLFNKKTWPRHEKITLPGEHNIENAAACLSVCRELGVDEHTIITATRSFTGLPGRLEFLREIDGVTYINDTTSTTPVAAIRGIQAFPRGNVILIAGGYSKKLPVASLADEIISRCKNAVFLGGNGTDELLGNLTEKGYVVDSSHIHQTLADAVTYARLLAVRGDVVLFSPGFASFNMYKNEFDRGNDYVTTVTSL